MGPSPPPPLAISFPPIHRPFRLQFYPNHLPRLTKVVFRIDAPSPHPPIAPPPPMYPL